MYSENTVERDIKANYIALTAARQDITIDLII